MLRYVAAFVCGMAVGLIVTVVWALIFAAKNYRAVEILSGAPRAGGAQAKVHMTENVVAVVAPEAGKQKQVIH
jgi:hypothetical protein